MTVRTFSFRLVEVRDERGALVRLQVLHHDLDAVQREIMAEPLFQAIMTANPQAPRLPMYLAKALATTDLLQPYSLWRALLMVRVCAGRAADEGVVFLQPRPGHEAIRRYASRYRLVIIPVLEVIGWRAWLRRVLPPRAKRLVQSVRFNWLAMRSRISSSQSKGGKAPQPSTGARLAVEYYGHLNLDHPERYSDLFFWQQSSLPAHDLVVLFHLSRDPLDDTKWIQLRRHGITALVLDPRASTVPEAPRYRLSRWPWRAGLRMVLPRAAFRRPERWWLREHLHRYQMQRADWDPLFASYQIRVFVSWFKYTEAHGAIADALHATGGVLAIYQRSFETHPSSEFAVACDVMFGFSKAQAEVERRSQSVIPYYVITGYLGDHRFPLLRPRAHAIRQRLAQHGATRVLSFTDENSHDETRWMLGHDITRENYAFLLEKVLREPWLGLIIKPKTPSTLRRRLGPVTESLARAEATGRCVIFEEGALQGSCPPAAAALASDVMIHGHLCAATAGVESALAGVPTLFMDREGWPESPFYRFGKDRVVFTDWPTLWRGCLDHWRRPEGIPGFGDWSPILSALDPFQDGRAAQRMGTYLQWLLEGFQAGLDREAVMADAAQRYARQWGRDKVISVDGLMGQTSLPNSDPRVSRQTEGALLVG